MLAQSLIGKSNLYSQKGLAICLLVFLHVVGTTTDSGFGLDDTSIFRRLNLIFDPIRMPLFAMVSGYIFGFSKEVGFYIGIFKKAKAILLPLLVGGVWLTCALLIKDKVSIVDFGYLYSTLVFTDKMYLWYMQSMFSIFVITYFLKSIDFFESKLKFLALIALFCIFQLIVPNDLRLFSISGTKFLAPYFFIGLYFYKNGIDESLIYLSFVSVIVLTVAGVIFGFNFEKNNTQYLVLSICSCTILLKYFSAKFLVGIGKQSFSIYLFHFYFVYAARMICINFDIDIELSILIGLFAGIYFPILINSLLAKSKLATLILKGEWRWS